MILVCIKYIMRDHIFDVISCCVSGCDIGNINVGLYNRIII